MACPGWHIVMVKVADLVRLGTLFHLFCGRNTLVDTRSYDQLCVSTFDTIGELAAAVADDLAVVLRQAIAEQGQASAIFATGNSQLAFFQALHTRDDIAWNRVSIFHMDEYMDLSDQHPASFRFVLQKRLVDLVRPRAFYGIAGDTRDVAAELARYTALLESHRPIACIMGIGENGHLAFNDPPADFTTRRMIDVVNLVDSCRQQQVGEGHFARLEDVPRQALSLTVPALLSPQHVFVIAPETRKADAVRAALEGPITPNCPASILRTVQHARLYLDRDSAALLGAQG
jgi:glucosamine-6-phosphate deaminase